MFEAWRGRGGKPIKKKGTKKTETAKETTHMCTKKRKQKATKEAQQEWPEQWDHNSDNSKETTKALREPQTNQPQANGCRPALLALPSTSQRQKLFVFVVACLFACRFVCFVNTIWLRREASVLNWSCCLQPRQQDVSHLDAGFNNTMFREQGLLAGCQ